MYQESASYVLFIVQGIHQIDELNTNLEKNVQAVIKDITNTLQLYKDETEPRRKEIEDMKMKDDFYTDMIIRQDTRMARLCVSI